RPELITVQLFDEHRGVYPVAWCEFPISCDRIGVELHMCIGCIIVVGRRHSEARAPDSVPKFVNGAGNGRSIAPDAAPETARNLPGDSPIGFVARCSLQPSHTRTRKVFDGWIRIERGSGADGGLKDW